MMKIILLALLGLVSTKHTQHDNNLSIDDKLKIMSEKIDALTNRVIKQSNMIES